MVGPLVVLDACVLFPPSLRDALLYPAVARLYRPAWSDAILDELCRNLTAKAGVPVAGAERLRQSLQQAFPGALVSPGNALSEVPGVDPKDRHVAQTALSAKAQLIVTANLRDFPAAALAPFGLTVTHPDGFLCDLVRHEPFVMAAAVQHQHGRLRKPPIPMPDFLEKLAGMVPGFVGLIRPLVAS